MSPIIIPVYCLQVVFTLQGGGTQTKPRRLIELRKPRLEFRKRRWLKFTGQITRKNTAQRESSGD